MKRTVLLLSVCVGLSSADICSVSGANFTWEGVSSTWTTANNWSGSAGVPGTLDNAIFGTLGNNRSATPTISSLAEIGSLTFNAGGAAFTISGAGPLTISGIGAVGIANNNLTATETLSVTTVNIGADQNWNNLGTLVVNGGTLALGENTLTLNGTGTTTISSDISGSNGDLTKSGIGTLTLSGANSYSGLTVLNGGVVNADSASAFGDSSLVSVFNTIVNLNTDLYQPDPTPPSIALGAGSVLNQLESNAAFANLAVNGNSTINLGTSGELAFDSATYAGGLLTINGWTGPADDGNGITTGATGAGIFITSNPTSSGLLPNVQFNGINGPYPQGAQWLGTGELVPVPEPQTYAAIFALGLLGFAMARRRLMASA